VLFLLNVTSLNERDWLNTVYTPLVELKKGGLQGVFKILFLVISLLILLLWLSYIFTLGDRVYYIIGVQWG
jgi:hypothetical protein